MSFIEIRNLKKEYPLEDQTIRALDNVSLTINRGELVIILGQSGCGKSTLLNVIGGMDKPTHGSIKADGEELTKKKQDDLSQYRREKIGMIFQKFNLIGDMSVIENVMLPLKFSGKSEKQQRAIALKALKDVGIEKRANSVPSKLSGGQQQRVAIARSLVNNPEILLCDEPTGNLDSKTGQEIIELLEELNKKGHTVIIVTHNEAYGKIADRIIKMLDGKVIEDRHQTRRKIDSSLDRVQSKTITAISRLKIAWKNLGRRKFRMFLTSCGVAIGAMAIVVLVSFGAGLQKDISDQLQSVSQVENITVTGDKQSEPTFSMGPTYEKTESKPLNDKTISDLASIQNVESVYSEVNYNGEIAAGDKLGRFHGTGMPPIKYVKDEIKNQVGFGRFLEKDDENSVVIPYGLATALGYEDVNGIIGKELTIRNLRNIKKEFKVTVVGVIKKDEKFAYAAYLPNQTAVNILKELKADELKNENPDLYNDITVRVNEAKNVSDTRKLIDDKGYGTSSYEDIAKTVGRTFAVIQVVLGVIGGIALLVASLGIMNTMLMSILERTREIGVMKAVGARSKDIRSIFLTDAMFIGLLGGLIGLLLGYGGTQLIGTIVNNYLEKQGTNNQEITFYIPYYLSLGVVAFSVFVSALAGYIPSRRAAKLDPVVALRDE